MLNLTVLGHPINLSLQHLALVCQPDYFIAECHHPLLESFHLPPQPLLLNRYLDHPFLASGLKCLVATLFCLVLYFLEVDRRQQLPALG